MENLECENLTFKATSIACFKILAYIWTLALMWSRIALINYLVSISSYTLFIGAKSSMNLLLYFTFHLVQCRFDCLVYKIWVYEEQNCLSILIYEEQNLLEKQTF